MGVTCGQTAMLLMMGVPPIIIHALDFLTLQQGPGTIRDLTCVEMFSGGPGSQKVTEAFRALVASIAYSM